MLLLALYCTYCAPTTFLYTLNSSQVMLWGLKRAMSGYLVWSCQIHCSVPSNSVCGPPKRFVLSSQIPKTQNTHFLSRFTRFSGGPVGPKNFVEGGPQSIYRTGLEVEKNIKISFQEQGSLSGWIWLDWMSVGMQDLVSSCRSGYQIEFQI